MLEALRLKAEGLDLVAEAKAVGEGGLTGAGVRRRVFRRCGNEVGDSSRTFLRCRVRAWLGFDGCSLLPAKPHGRLHGRPGLAGQAGQVGLLLDALFFHGGAMLEQGCLISLFCHRDRV
jgi:hypothetical protein